jgi:hypothetical protein
MGFMPLPLSVEAGQSDAGKCVLLGKEGTDLLEYPVLPRLGS